MNWNFPRERIDTLEKKKDCHGGEVILATYGDRKGHLRRMDFKRTIKRTFRELNLGWYLSFFIFLN